MTALDQYIRLEAPGRWREREGAAWREVVVSFGNASLVLSDFSEEPLTHWSLAAVECVLRDGKHAVYAPDGNAAEALEMADETMIDAIEKVTAAARHRLRPARKRQLRRPVLLGLMLLALVAALWWGPDLLRSRAASLITPEQAELITERLRPALPGKVCRTPEGLRALRAMTRRLGVTRRVEVRNWDAPALALLPDRTIVLGRAVLEKGDSAEELAGWIALGATAGPHATPLVGWANSLTPREAITFLSSGDISRADISRIAAEIAASGAIPDPADIDRAFAALRAADVRVGPIARTLGRDPGAEAETAYPVLRRDGDWVALQNMCDS